MILINTHARESYKFLGEDVLKMVQMIHESFDG